MANTVQKRDDDISNLVDKINNINRHGSVSGNIKITYESNKKLDLSGSFCNVYKGTCGDRDPAASAIKLLENNQSNLIKISNEIKIFNKYLKNNQYIQQYYHRIDDQTYIYAAYELYLCSLYDVINNPNYCPKNALIQSIRQPTPPVSIQIDIPLSSNKFNYNPNDFFCQFKNGTQSLPRATKRKFFSSRFIKLCLNLLNALHELHSSNIYHDNITPMNLLIINNVCKISDIGSCVHVMKSKLNRNKLGFQEDIARLGCLFNYLFSQGEYAYTDYPNLNYCKNIEVIPPEFCDLISWMTHKKPNKRPNTTQCKAHPFFWDNKKKLDFLALIHNSKKNIYYFVNGIEAEASTIIGKDWGWFIDYELLVKEYNKIPFDYPPTIDLSSVCDYNGLIRNTREHIFNYPPILQNKFQTNGSYSDDKFMYYFTQYTPMLFISYYKHFGLAFYNNIYGNNYNQPYINPLNIFRQYYENVPSDRFIMQNQLQNDINW